jgi:hypothetical protein
MKWIIVAGDFTKGFYFIGPFGSEDSATEYAKDAISRYSKSTPWSIVELDEPGE